jgi:hypothetical protein
MGIRDTMRMAAEPYLIGGEEIQALFGAQTARPGVLIVSNGLPLSARRPQRARWAPAQGSLSTWSSALWSAAWREWSSG